MARRSRPSSGACGAASGGLGRVLAYHSRARAPPAGGSPGQGASPDGSGSSLTVAMVHGRSCSSSAPAVIVWRKGRPSGPGEVFRASRMSAGNRVFPTQVRITPTSVVHFTPQWVGKLEHSIHMAHIASVSIDTQLLFSDVYIETTGGARPIQCRGHHKADAVRMKQLDRGVPDRLLQAARRQSPPSAERLAREAGRRHVARPQVVRVS